MHKMSYQLSCFHVPAFHCFKFQVMEQATDAEKAMPVIGFLDFKRKNKVCAL